jgi:hypothetical protein
MSDASRRVIVDVWSGSSEESWIVVEPDGSLIYHVENTGYRCLRRGLEKHDRRITFAEVAEIASHYPSRDILGEVEAALPDLAGRGD